MNTLAGGRWTREILKMKKRSLYEYKWFGLACASGIMGLNPLDCIRQAKEMYPEIDNNTQECIGELPMNIEVFIYNPNLPEKLLDEQLTVMGEAIQGSFHKTFGKGKSI